MSRTAELKCSVGQELKCPELITKHHNSHPMPAAHQTQALGRSVELLSDRRLTRHEFVAALVGIAMLK